MVGNVPKTFADLAAYVLILIFVVQWYYLLQESLADAKVRARQRCVLFARY